MAHYLDTALRGTATSRDAMSSARRAPRLRGRAAQIDDLVVHSVRRSPSSRARASRPPCVSDATGEWGAPGHGDSGGYARRPAASAGLGWCSASADLQSPTPATTPVLFGSRQGPHSATWSTDMFAAVSDQGTIRRARLKQAPHALKADAVPNAVFGRGGPAPPRRGDPQPRPGFLAQRRHLETSMPTERLRIAHFLRVHSEANRSEEPADAGAGVAGPAPLAPATTPAIGRAPEAPRRPARIARDGVRLARPSTTIVQRCGTCAGHDLWRALPAIRPLRLLPRLRKEHLRATAVPTSVEAPFGSAVLRSGSPGPAKRVGPP